MSTTAIGHSVYIPVGLSVLWGNGGFDALVLTELMGTLEMYWVRWRRDAYPNTDKYLFKKCERTEVQPR